MDLGRIVALVGGGLGVLGFIFGFLPGLKVSDGRGITLSASVYGTSGYLPILILLAGLLAVAPLLPGGKNYAPATALVSVAGFLGAVTSLTSGTSGLLSVGTSAGIGLILLLIVGFLQAAAAVYGALLEAGTLKPAAARQAVTPAPAQPAPFGGYGNPGYPAAGLARATAARVRARARVCCLRRLPPAVRHRRHPGGGSGDGPARSGRRTTTPGRDATSSLLSEPDHYPLSKRRGDADGQPLTCEGCPCVLTDTETGEAAPSRPTTHR